MIELPFSLELRPAAGETTYFLFLTDVSMCSQIDKYEYRFPHLCLQISGQSLLETYHGLHVNTAYNIRFIMMLMVMMVKMMMLMKAMRLMMMTTI